MVWLVLALLGGKTLGACTRKFSDITIHTTSRSLISVGEKTPLRTAFSRKLVLGPAFFPEENPRDTEDVFKFLFDSVTASTYVPPHLEKHLSNPRCAHNLINHVVLSLAAESKESPLCIAQIIRNRTSELQEEMERVREKIERVIRHTGFRRFICGYFLSAPFVKGVVVMLGNNPDFKAFALPILVFYWAIGIPLAGIIFSLPSLKDLSNKKELLCLQYNALCSLLPGVARQVKWSDVEIAIYDSEADTMKMS